jgi:cytochrome c5
MKKLINVISLLVVSTATVGAQAADQAVVDRYNKTCVVCHAAGAAGAPKTGVAKEWAPRMEKGMDAMILSVEKGINAMPPKGMCFDCTADDFKALIEYMAADK